MSAEVKVERILSGDPHTDQKWFVLQGSVPGSPESTWKRVSIAVAALVQRPQLLESARTKLIADVTEYHGNFLALQELG